MDNDIWKFTSSVSDNRTKALLNPPSFEAIIESIQKEMKILCLHEQSCDDADGYSRVIFCIKVSQHLFDLFFNSAHGYRAWYYYSPYDGLRNNELFIQSLMPVFLSSSHMKEKSKGNDLTKKVTESLKSYSAKVWLAERGTELCSKCEGEWNTPQDNSPEIINGRWDQSDTPNAQYMEERLLI